MGHHHRHSGQGPGGGSPFGPQFGQQFGWGGGWHDAPWGGRGRPGPPPWLAGLFGLAQGAPPNRGPKVRRGDVRAAILDVLRAEPMNGYQVIAQITERSRGAWKPSPGSIYPTISQLEDEGLVESDQESGRRKLKLSPDGWEYVSANRAELDAVWEPFEAPGDDGGETGERRDGGFSGLKPEIGQVMNAVWQIVTTGSEQQKRDAIEILVDTRRRLYGLLAEGDAEEGWEGERS